MNINEELLNVQQEWFKSNFTNLIQQSSGVMYSVPFVYGCSSHSISAPSVMAIGQEAYDFPIYDKSNVFNLESQQEWTVRFLEKQAFGINNDQNYEKSPFWNLFRMMTKKGLSPSWNNVDKVHRIIVSNDKKITKPLSVNDERILDECLEINGYTLLQNEIRIVKPDTIVFLTGPNYFETMAFSLNVDKDILYEMRPRKTMPINDISAVVDNGIRCLWSYHPKYLRMLGGNKLFEQMIDIILNAY